MGMGKKPVLGTFRPDEKAALVHTMVSENQNRFDITARVLNGSLWEGRFGVVNLPRTPSLAASHVRANFAIRDDPGLRLRPTTLLEMYSEGRNGINLYKIYHSRF